MSLEAKIENLSAVIEKLISALESNAVTVKETPAAPLAAPVSVTPTNPAPSVQTAPAAPAPAPTQMPAPPVFAPVAALEAVPEPVGTRKAPFDDAKGLVDYVMKAYREMGPVKGANIQKVLVAVGHQNINDVQPQHYCEVWTGIEKLRTA